MRCYVKKTHDNKKYVDTDLKIMYTLFTLHVSLSLVTPIIVSRVFFQYEVDFLHLSSIHTLVCMQLIIVVIINITLCY